MPLFSFIQAVLERWGLNQGLLETQGFNQGVLETQSLNQGLLERRGLWAPTFEGLAPLELPRSTLRCATRLCAKGVRKRPPLGTPQRSRLVRPREFEKRGFSLLEVMVALAIFGLMISGILAAQGGVAASNKKAVNMGQATNMGRCKMTELEEKLLKFGYAELDDKDTDVLCCENGETKTFTCDYAVEKVVMPDPPSSALSMDGGVSQLFGMTADGGGLAGGPGLDFDSGLGGIASALGPQTGSAGAAGLVDMAMGIVYPMMKPMMEASIRKITVTVKWKEGPNPQKFVLVQYVTNPQRGGFVPGMFGGDGGAPAPATTGSTTVTSPATSPLIGGPR